MRLLTILPLILVVGCAGGMSKDECLVADWRAIGYEDGARGLSASAVSSRRQACAKKAGVAPDMAAYLAGREEGLEEFCTPASAYAYGARGGQYDGVCANHDERAFIASYETGYRFFDLTVRANAASNAVAAAHRDLNHVKASIVETEALLISPATPHPARIDLLVDLKHLQDRKREIEDAMPALYRDRDVAVADLEDYRRDVDAQGDRALSPVRARY